VSFIGLFLGSFLDLSAGIAPADSLDLEQ
jgi:hypothetical protein